MIIEYIPGVPKLFQRLMEHREKASEPKGSIPSHFNLKFGISWEEIRYLKWNYEL